MRTPAIVTASMSPAAAAAQSQDFPERPSVAFKLSADSANAPVIGSVATATAIGPASKIQSGRSCFSDEGVCRLCGCSIPSSHELAGGCAVTDATWSIWSSNSALCAPPSGGDTIANLGWAVASTGTAANIDESDGPAEFDASSSACAGATGAGGADAAAGFTMVNPGATATSEGNASTMDTRDRSAKSDKPTPARAGATEG